MNSEQRIAARNRKARHDYHVVDTLETGLVLVGSEIKSIRAGKVSLSGSHAGFDDSGELYVWGMTVAEYPEARENHIPDRPRKLLAHVRELRRLARQVEEKGMTLIPLDVHFSERGQAKLLLGVCRGKKQFDKRADLAERDSQRRLQAAMKHGLREQ
jgi:SsrA-binding protein